MAATAMNSGPPGRPAVFLDRDGTLIHDRGYPDDPAQVTLLPGVAAALRDLGAAGFLRVVITNQSGIGRGRYTAEQFGAIQDAMRRMLRLEGADIDAAYWCPHAPDAGCLCRKPGTALYREAIAAHEIDLTRSWCIGDRIRDLLPSVELGCRALMVYPERHIDERDAAREIGADLAPDLAAGAAIICRYL